MITRTSSLHSTLRTRSNDDFRHKSLIRIFIIRRIKVATDLSACGIKIVGTSSS